MYTQFATCSFVATAFDFNSCNDQIHVHKHRYAYIQEISILILFGCPQQVVSITYVSS